MEEIRDPQAVLDALERAKADAKRYREEAESLTQQLADQRSEFEAQLKTANDTTLELQSKVKRSMVESAVRNAKGNERVMRFIDLDSINVEDDNLVGFDAALDKVKVDLPEPETPVIQVMIPIGKDKSTSCKLLPDAPLSSMVIGTFFGLALPFSSTSIVLAL